MTITTTQPIIRENSVDKFNVKLNQFEGPFDLLLSLIAKHELEVTALSLHIVTDDFLQYIKNQGSEWDLDEATEFLVIAATLLDLKTARLLPSGEVEDEEDIARLEARDLLFARLMQYKAFKDVSFWLNDQLSIESKRFARSVSLEPQFANLLPEVLLGLGPNELARLAAKAMEVKTIPSISLSHLHAPAVSVREQAGIIVERLRRVGATTFRSLISGVEVPVVVARFLAILELFRESQITLEQESPLADLYIRWVGTEQGEIELTDEFDSDTRLSLVKDAENGGGARWRMKLK
jgi:segregation and condensation protein A